MHVPQLGAVCCGGKLFRGVVPFMRLQRSSEHNKVPTSAGARSVHSLPHAHVANLIPDHGRCGVFVLCGRRKQPHTFLSTFLLLLQDLSEISVADSTDLIGMMALLIYDIA